MIAHSDGERRGAYGWRMNRQFQSAFSGCVALLVLLTGCGGAASGAAPAVASTAGTGAGSSGSSDKTTALSYSCPVAQTSSGSLNCASLPIGDQKYSLTKPQQGYVYACMAASGSAPAPAQSEPWIGANTWNMLTKAVVEGSVSWSGSISITTNAGTRTIVSNGLPVSPYTTGTYPVSSSDPASEFGGDPNSIAQHEYDIELPQDPSVAATPSCVPMGPIGITVTGVSVYNAFDANDNDANANEIQDACHGHPDPSETYHYHGFLQTCVPDAGSATQNSSLLAYAFDGFGIYGPWYNGKILTSADLDECHGTTSPVMWDGQLVNIYHYVSTYDFPYTVGCYRGTPVPVRP